ncbi:hypothetical protein [Streptomyces prasinopilosus]|uniref:Uncharacterized protein n=1 Tax=Streptomyces prasinopilosus TaxID=67344 RepID=A0A1G6UCV6_9ACTN|nr:hypothetical protein [Streptomyces prasinopilosus]SDD39153.1 hypothetical protein SAMN05216505_107127 [Streptomyces prasinopilosus]
MTNTFEELVAKQRAVDEAHVRVRHLQETYGPPTDTKWSSMQTTTWETAWRAWRDLARELRTAVSDFARAEGKPRHVVEAEVKQAALDQQEGGADT